MATTIMIKLSDNLVDPDQKIGAIVRAALHANGQVTVVRNTKMGTDLPEADDAR